MKEFKTTFEAFKYLVKTSGMPKSTLAKKAGLYPQQLTNIQQDKRVSFDIVKKIAEATGKSITIKTK